MINCSKHAKIELIFMHAALQMCMSITQIDTTQIHYFSMVPHLDKEMDQQYIFTVMALNPELLIVIGIILIVIMLMMQECDAVSDMTL